MRTAAECLLGRHDFSSFRAAGCAAHTPVREITSVSLFRSADIIVFEISANAFLQHMVRNIVGLLVEIGKSDLPPGHMRDILDKKNRKLSAATARPNGLYFVDVEYPPELSIPKNRKGPAFLI